MHLLRIYKPTKEGGKENATPRPFSSRFAQGIAEAFMFGYGGVPEVERRDEEKFNAVCGQVFGTVRITREWVGEQ